jgi:KDO2-lipid IV(A) lauroyltransferase
MVIHKPYEITKTGVHEEDLKNNSLTINQNIEKMIIKNPTQWIWTHDRWK